MNSLRQACLTLVCVVIAAPVAAPLQAQNASGSGGITVSGKRLLRDGKPWIPHGFFQIAFAVPPAAFGNTVDGKAPNPAFQIAYTYYSPSEYADMRQAGADSVRMNVAQDGADPENKYYFDEEWFNTVVGAVQAARAAGLSVIISIQNEAQTGNAGSPLPTDATRRVWRKLAPIFGQDRGVLFELYNEPNLHPGSSPDTAPSLEDWGRWAEAMNKTLSVVRNLGAVNVIVADGLVSAQQLSGAPKLSDPLHQVAYASHPYPSGSTAAIGAYNQTAPAWDEKFGDFAQTEPVIVTEWGAGYYCDSNTPRAVVSFLGYLQQHNVGLEAVAWDWGPYNFASAVQGFPNTVFSSLRTPTGPEACSAPNYAPGTGQGPGTAFGPGNVIETWYRSGLVPTTPE
jgi:endoglucanase